MPSIWFRPSWALWLGSMDSLPGKGSDDCRALLSGQKVTPRVEVEAPSLRFLSGSKGQRSGSGSGEFLVPHIRKMPESRFFTDNNLALDFESELSP